ncbi:hypothetical protein F5888DRAFT_1652749 [Russula emetica]|nr:hypothetical protein F5888DRAFT_1652749 [Russula emetica]
MGGASSTQRGGKATQSQPILRESTNANTPKDIAQAANIAKDNPASLNIEQDPKKDDAALTKSTGPDDVTTAILYKTTNPATKVFDQTASFLQPSVNSVPGVIPESANAVSRTASQPTKDGPAFTLSTDQGRKVLGRIDIRDPKIGTQGEKKTRRGRGKRKGKDTRTARDGTENIPPPANQQNTLSRRRRARGTGYVDIGTKPAPPRRGRARSSVRGAETTNVADYVASQSVEAFIEDVKTTGRHSDVDKALEHGRRRSDAGIRPKHRGRRRLASQGDSRQKPEPAFIPSEVEDVEIPKTDKDTAFKTAGGLASDEDHRRSAANSLLPCGERKLPEATKEGDVSIVQPLPSSTRRRAKEYFQRRTRERSVDPVGGHARQPHRHVSMVEQERRSSAQIPNRPESIANRDQFVFDPEASPFTPNATSSPRQASLSSIVVQSFSSPTPLPSHGNRNVVPLVLPETSNGSNQLETKRDSMIPITSHDITTHGLAYTYAGANQAQAHIQAEQISLMRLQAYYNWLAGSIPTTTAVGITIHQSEHMEMSGGGGGLSGGVALGRHAQIQGLGKGQQRRNASSAYAHPKEHVIFSHRDHERTEVGSSESVLQKGIVQSGKGESEKEPEGTCEGEARRKWDGKWGLRQPGASGKEIGWSWGTRDP